MISLGKPLALASVALGLAACSAVQTMPTVVNTAAPVVRVYAAGSLREALTLIASEHEARTGQKIELTFGASGLLRERLEKGELAQVYASADTDHPQRLAAGGQWQVPKVFVRNALCALTTDKVRVTPETLLAVMLQPEVRLGTSTPKADPAGDYAWALFRKAEGQQPGAYARLDAKALKLVGGADSPKAPAGRGTYAWLMDENQADVFLTYCTNAVAAQKEVPRLQLVPLPSALRVDTAYALTVASSAPQPAVVFAQALLASPAQAIFRRFGFVQP